MRPAAQYLGQTNGTLLLSIIFEHWRNLCVCRGHSSTYRSREWISGNQKPPLHPYEVDWSQFLNKILKRGVKFYNMISKRWHSREAPQSTVHYCFSRWKWIDSTGHWKRHVHGSDLYQQNTNCNLWIQGIVPMSAGSTCMCAFRGWVQYQCALCRHQRVN